jgi:WD40 repeat protein
MGFKAKVYLWDFYDNVLLKCWEYHQVEVSSLAFSPSDKYLASMGGVDDGSI